MRGIYANWLRFNVFRQRLVSGFLLRWALPLVIMVAIDLQVINRKRCNVSAQVAKYRKSHNTTSQIYLN
jgi:hypothetical protein